MNTNNNISQEQLEAIDRYLNDSMDANERKEFDIKLNEDAAFKTIFENTKALIIGIESAALKDELAGFHQDLDEDVIPLYSKKKGNSRYMLYSVAASLVVLIGLFWMFAGDTSSEKLFAKHFIPDPGLPTVMSATDEYEFYDAMVNYKQEEYTTAINKWEKILPNKPENDTLNFYIGVSYLANGDATKAKHFLEKTLETKNSIFINDAYYFAALAQLKNENITEAKVLLEKSNSSQSKALLKDLNN